jgi:hypothetical protein
MYRSPLDESDFLDIGVQNVRSAEAQDEHGWKARADCAAWPIPEPFDWNANPFDDRNWYAQFHGWRVMDPYLAAYARDGDPGYLRRITPWMANWSDYRDSAPPERLRTLWPLSGMRACRLAHVLDAYRLGLLELHAGEWEALYDIALVDAKWLMTPGNVVLMNHAFFQTMGLDRLGRVLGDDPAFAEASTIARERFAQLVRSQFTDEGVHVENSPGYHAYALGQIAKAGSLVQAEPEFVERAKGVLPWLIFPDGRYSEVGDSEGTSGSPLADPGAALVSCGGTEYAVAPFWRSGYAVVRSDPSVPPSESSMLLLAGTSHSHTHSHADKLTFELFERGRRLIVDTGKYGYTRDPMRDYVISDAAHNTVGLADETILRHKAVLGGTVLSEPSVDGDEFLLGGEVTWTVPIAFRHRRRLRYRPGRSLVIKDEIASGSAVRFASRLHFDRSLDLDRIDNVLTAEFDDYRLTAELITEGWELSLHRGQTDPIRGWQSVGYLQMESSWMAEATCPAETFWPTVEWRISIAPRSASGSGDSK